MTQAPATPELVERLETFSETYTSLGKIVLGQTLQEAADALEAKDKLANLLSEKLERRTLALEAQQARIAELEAESARWAFRFADIREASGVGVVPMLSDLPSAIKAKLEASQDLADRLMDTLAPFMPISISNTPDYAELSFGGHSTQAMTIAPSDWLRLSEVYGQALSSQGRREGGEG